ncbi:MAG TPA: hypothetical protein VK590_11525, partial [Saprospiraceae bacterium]|nr:hypothetical protein [Saprospiraceae bacterium]
MSKNLTINIPFDLARYATGQRKLITKYETNQVIKALDTWLVLKAESRSSWLQNWNDQKKHLFTICKISETIFRHRLKVLQGLELLTYDRNAIRLCSWDDLQTVLQCDISKKFTIDYDIFNSQKVSQWLIATEIKDNQNRQDFKIIKNLNQNPAIIKRVISALIKAGAKENQLCDIGYFLTWLRILYYSDFVQASEIHDLLIEVRPDNNRGVKGIANAWNNKVFENDDDYRKQIIRLAKRVSYWKKVLQKSAIVAIGKIQVQSENRVRNTACKVLWLKETKQTLLCLCDQITV